MSAYDNDPRVGRDGNVFNIVIYPGCADERTGRVQPAGGEWEAFGLIGGGDFVRHFHATEDEAIRSLIGDPQ